MTDVEKVARALASADGLDWDEVCGVDDPATEGFCESGTCIAAHWEDHDQEQARRWYLHLAQAALSAIDPVALVQAGIDAAAEACAKQRDDFLSPQYAVGQPISSMMERFACDECGNAIRAMSAADVLKEMK